MLKATTAKRPRAELSEEADRRDGGQTKILDAVDVAESTRDTTSEAYWTRLTVLRTKRWKHYAPNPYRWWLRHQRPGYLLDVGCGVGRSLAFVGGHGVGVDHNPHSVEACLDAGLVAFTHEDFAASEYAVPGRFDALSLLARSRAHGPFGS